MRRLTPFENFSQPLNEAEIMYTTDDVRNAFADIEDDIKDYYTVDDDSAKITLSWSLRYGTNFDVESSLDHIEFEFDIYAFGRDLTRYLSHDEDTKGPTFTKDEVLTAIDSAAYSKDIFLGSFEYNVNNAKTTIEAEEDSYSTEVTIRGKLEDDSIDVDDAKVDTEDIIDAIIEELLKGVAKRIDYSR